MGTGINAIKIHKSCELARLGSAFLQEAFFSRTSLSHACNKITGIHTSQ